MSRYNRPLLFIVVPAIAAGLALACISFTSSLGQTSASVAGTGTSQAYFAQLATVLQHPRCMNCHTSTNFPRQGDDGHPHIMQVRRGRSDAGTPALPCSSCHQKSNSASGVPGNAVWRLAPLRMAWEGLTAGDICRSLTDPAKGGMTQQRLVERMTTDHLVAWAWDPGVDLTGKQRSIPPLSHAAFAKFVRQWVESGAACPT